METILNKLENFETKLNNMFNGNEELPFSYDLTVEEVEEFKNSFTQEEIQKLKDLYSKLFYEGYHYPVVLRLLAFIEKCELETLNKIYKPWVEKRYDFFRKDVTTIEFNWDDEFSYQSMNLTHVIEQIKRHI